ncbi:MAG: acyltransferase family protein [Pseudomonadota bacterium]
MLLEERDRTGRISWGRFAARRVLRLYPALLATLLLAWGLMLIGSAIGYGSLLGFLSQALFFHNDYVVAADMQPAIPFGTSVLWSLAVEAHFYLLFPILVLLARSDARLTWAIVALLVAARIWRFGRVADFGADDWAIYISTDTRVDSILWGAFLPSQSDAISFVGSFQAGCSAPGWWSLRQCWRRLLPRSLIERSS